MYSYGFQAHKSSKYIKSPRTSIAIAMHFRSFRAPYNSNDKWMWLMVVPQRNWKIKRKNQIKQTPTRKEKQSFGIYTDLFLYLFVRIFGIDSERICVCPCCCNASQSIYVPCAMWILHESPPSHTHTDTTVDFAISHLSKSPNMPKHR